MRTFNHTHHKSYIDLKVRSNEETSFKLKIICSDGVIFCDRILFILWSKHWREILEPQEETSVLIFPDVTQSTMKLLIELLKAGDIRGLESNFENFFELALDFFSDLPGGFSNFETSEKSFDVKAQSIKNIRSKFKTLRKLTCEFCVSTFASKQSKDRHIENCHQPKKVHKCSQCKLVFKSKEGLLTHRKTKHENVKFNICHICDVRFTNAANLKRHLKTKHDREDYTCLTCKKVFKSRSKLEKHQTDLSHPPNETLEKKKLSCSMCDFTTSRKDSLLRHKRLIHQLYRKDFTAIEDTLEEDGKWTCSKCDQTFTSLVEIEGHVISCEEIRCNWCDKKFTLRSHLKRHNKEKHPFVCGNCKERFKNEKYLNKHLVKCWTGE